MDVRLAQALAAGVLEKVLGNAVEDIERHHGIGSKLRFEADAGVDVARLQ